MHWIILGAGLVIAALFGTTLWQAREIGSIRAEVAYEKAAREFQEETARMSQMVADGLAEATERHRIELEGLANERDRYRLIAEREAIENPVGFGDAFELDLALWMRCVEAGGDGARETCRVHAAGTGAAASTAEAGAE